MARTGSLFLLLASVGVTGVFTVSLAGAASSCDAEDRLNRPLCRLREQLAEQGITANCAPGAKHETNLERAYCLALDKKRIREERNERASESRAVRRVRDSRYHRSVQQRGRSFQIEARLKQKEARDLINRLGSGVDTEARREHFLKARSARRNRTDLAAERRSQRTRRRGGYDRNRAAAHQGSQARRTKQQTFILEVKREIRQAGRLRTLRNLPQDVQDAFRNDLGSCAEYDTITAVQECIRGAIDAHGVE